MMWWLKRGTGYQRRSYIIHHTSYIIASETVDWITKETSNASDEEASDEEETNVKLGSFYEALAAKKALACRRNAIQYDENLIAIS